MFYAVFHLRARAKSMKPKHAQYKTNSLIIAERCLASSRDEKKLIVIGALNTYLSLGNFDVALTNDHRLLYEFNASCFVEMILDRHSLSVMLSPTIINFY